MLQKNTVTIIFVLMFFVLVYYVYKTTIKKPAAAPPVVPPVAQPPVAPTGNYIPPPQPKPTGTGATPAPTPSAGGVDKNKALSTGSKGESVKALQTLLSEKGYADSTGKALVIDGSYGAKTKYAHDNAMRSIPTSTRSINALANLKDFSFWGGATGLANTLYGTPAPLMEFSFWNPMSWGLS